MKDPKLLNRGLRGHESRLGHPTFFGRLPAYTYRLHTTGRHSLVPELQRRERSGSDKVVVNTLDRTLPWVVFYLKTWKFLGWVVQESNSLFLVIIMMFVVGIALNAAMRLTRNAAFQASSYHNRVADDLLFESCLAATLTAFENDPEWNDGFEKITLGDQSGRYTVQFLIPPPVPPDRKGR